MTFESIKAREQSALAQTYARYPVALASGKGARCLDTEGREYIDFTSGIGVNALGFCDEGWTQAAAKQLMTLQHACNLFYTEPMVQVAEKLTARTGLSRVFFANSGAEANEGAIKAARKYAFDHFGPGKSTIVTLQNSFHGRTVTTLSATGQDVFHNFFFPFTDGFAFAPANDWAGTLAAIDERACAVMMEMVQGEGGVVPLDPAYVKRVAAHCREKGLLLIVDEVQTGIGRTGSLFCYEQFGIEPDIVSAAKGLGGGLPIGAVLLGKKVENTLSLGQHGTTFGGNPVACAGASYILDQMDEAFFAAVREKGEALRTKIQGMPGVVSVTGMGLMLGIQLDGASAKDVVTACLRQGLLVLTAKQKLRLLPPLNLSQGDLAEGLARLERALAEAKA